MRREAAQITNLTKGLRGAQRRLEAA